MITWSNNWISKWESSWSILSKICVSNSANGYELYKGLVKKQNTYRIYADYKHCFVITPNIDSELFVKSLDFNLNEYLKMESSELLGPFYTNVLDNLYFQMFYDTGLKFCPDCIKNGYHSMFHQLTFLDQCLIHNIKLKKNCPQCSKNIPYNFSMQAYQTGYRCQCGYKLYDKIVTDSIFDWFEFDMDYYFTPFKKYKDSSGFIILPNSFSAHSLGLEKFNSESINVIKNMFLNKEIDFKQYYCSLNQNKTQEIKKHYLSETIYHQALKTVKHHLKRKYKIKSSQLEFYSKKSNIQYKYHVLNSDDEKYKKKQILSCNHVWTINSYAFFLWLRESEVTEDKFYSYKVFTNDNDYSFRLPILNIIDIMVNKIFAYYNPISKLYFNLMLRLAILLLLSRFIQCKEEVLKFKDDYANSLEILLNSNYHNIDSLFYYNYIALIKGNSYRLYFLKSD